MSVNDIDIRLERIKKSFKSKCSDVFTEDERKHLEEALHADLDGYWEEIKDVFVKDPQKSIEQYGDDNIIERDFTEWKNLSNSIFKKCKLNKWEIPNDQSKL